MDSLWTRPYVLCAIAAGTLSAGLAVAAACWWLSGSIADADYLLGTYLAILLVLSYQFPVHMGGHGKLYPGSISLYLLAVLLTPALAMVAAGVGIALGEALVAEDCDTTLADGATQTGRWMLIVGAGSVLAHMSGPAPFPWLITLVVVAVILWVGDITTSPLLLGPMSGMPALAIMRMVLVQGSRSEVIQYCLAAAGAALASSVDGLVPLLILPVGLLACSFWSLSRDVDRELLVSPVASHDRA